MNYKAGMYWLTGVSILHPRRPIPVVLVLENGRLSMTGPDGDVFSVPISSVSVEFPRADGMRLVINDARYLLGMQKGLGRAFTKEQIEMLNQASKAGNGALAGMALSTAGASALSVNGPGTLGGAAGGVVGAAGEAEALWALHNMDKVINTWEEVFANNDLRFTKRIHHTARNTLIAIGILILMAGLLAYYGSKLPQGGYGN